MKKDNKSIYFKQENNCYKASIGYNIDIIDEIKEVYEGSKICIITDDIVFSLYGQDLLNKLRDEFACSFITIKHGEENKNINSVSYIYDRLIEENFTRTDLIIGFGGGIIGDIAGFVASTFMRGVDFINIPTTLLAQVDSCVGGKTGYNNPAGKNMIGSFYFPLKVIVDYKYLDTLDEKQVSNGLAEVIKYALINDKDFFDFLEANTIESIKKEYFQLIYKSLQTKKYFVEGDSHDKGIRMKLNFGHTYGHALERYYKYEKYSHGAAVAIGMAYVTSITEKSGFTKAGSLDRIIAVLKKYNLEYEMPSECKSVLHEAIKKDKKNQSGVINLIQLREIGKVEIVKREM